MNLTTTIDLLLILYKALRLSVLINNLYVSVIIFESSSALEKSGKAIKSRFLRELDGKYI